MLPWTSIPSFLRILIGIVAALALPSPAQTVVERWHPVDLVFTAGTQAGNPYQDVTLEATFTGPGNAVLKVPGFHVGGNAWKVRFAPTVVGTWAYVTASNDARLQNVTGTVTCVPNTRALVHGRLGVDPANPHHFRFEDGTPYFLLGGEIDWLALISLGDTTLARTRAIIDMYASHGFTQIILNAYAWDTTWKPGKSGPDDFGPPAQYAWAGSNGNPDHSRLNPDFWAHYDRVIDYLFQKGIGAYIMFKVYNKQVSWPAKGSRNDEMYFSQIVARYQAYPNVVWCFSKESFYETDHAYIAKMMDLVTAKDAYKRLRTTHDDLGRPPDYAITATNLDFRTDQQETEVYATALGQRNARRWPIYNAELGYEIGNDGGHTYSHVAAKEVVLKRAYEVLMAGGYPAYYYTYHAWDVVRTTEVPNGLKFYRHMAGFIQRTNWFDMAPSDHLLGTKGVNHCLAKAGTGYIVYLENGGSTTLSVEGAGKTFRGIWMNAYTGQEQVVAPAGPGQRTLNAPWAGAPSVLWLHDGTATALRSAAERAVRPGGRGLDRSADRGAPVDVRGRSASRAIGGILLRPIAKIR